MKIALVVAYDLKLAIGEGGDLPWGRSLPKDLENFKRITTGGVVVMGRKTYQSIGSKPLPGRQNIILSKSLPTKSQEGVYVARSLKEALDKANGANIYIIGGSNVFKEGLVVADKIYATEVKKYFLKTDTFFPAINPDDWQEIERLSVSADVNNKYDFDFVTYERKT